MEPREILAASLAKSAAEFRYRPLSTGHAAATGAVAGGLGGAGLGALTGLFADKGDKARTALRNALIGGGIGAGAGGLAGGAAAPFLRAAITRDAMADPELDDPKVMAGFILGSMGLAGNEALTGDWNASNRERALAFLGSGEAEVENRVRAGVSDTMRDDVLPALGLSLGDVKDLLTGRFKGDNQSFLDLATGSINDAWGTGSQGEAMGAVGERVSRRAVGLPVK